MTDLQEHVEGISRRAMLNRSAAALGREHQPASSRIDALGPTAYQLQEDGHASYWGQLAMRNCLRPALSARTRPGRLRRR